SDRSSAMRDVKSKALAAGDNLEAMLKVADAVRQSLEATPDQFELASAAWRSIHTAMQGQPRCGCWLPTHGSGNRSISSNQRAFPGNLRHPYTVEIRRFGFPCCRA